MHYVRMAAQLIAPVIEKDLAAGFDWIIEHLKAPRSAILQAATGGGSIGAASAASGAGAGGPSGLFV